MKLNKITKRKSLGLVSCFGLLGLLAVMMLCPVAGNKASAEGEVTETKNTMARALVKPVISVALDARVDVDVVPTSTGSFSTNSMNLTVSTNNTSGFAVLLNGIDGTDLKATSSTNTSSIKSITAAADQTGFANNTWGAYVNEAEPSASTVYQPVTESPTQMTKTDTANAKTTYKLAFGAKVNTEIPAGTYQRQVLVSVVANPLEVDSLLDMVYMQDMTPEICAHSSEGDTTQLMDSRDGKMYWVAKMKDGRCWMTQNLALTFGDPTTNPTFVNKLTSSDSDLAQQKFDTVTGAMVNMAGVPTEWSYTTGTYKMQNTEFTVPAAITNPPQTDTRSWNLGEWVLATPLLTTSCGDVTNIATCTKVGFVNVADTTKFKPGYTATYGNWQGANATNNTLVAVNCTEWSGSGTSKVCTAGTYDEHYLIGNYYQYNTATAGSGGTITNADAKNSICPKGWQLPTAGSQADGKSGSFQNLLSKYGVASSVSGTGVDGVAYNIAAGPLYFVRSGYVYLPTTAGTFRDAGAYGIYWSSRGAAYTSSTSATAYYLQVEPSAVVPSDGPTNRWVGFPLRCLSTVLDM